MSNLLNKFADKIHSKDGTNESENITDQQNLQRQRGAGGQQWDSNASTNPSGSGRTGLRDTQLSAMGGDTHHGMSGSSTIPSQQQQHYMGSGSGSSGAGYSSTSGQSGLTDPGYNTVSSQKHTAYMRNEGGMGDTLGQQGQQGHHGHQMRGTSGSMGSQGLGSGQQGEYMSSTKEKIVRGTSGRRRQAQNADILGNDEEEEDEW